MELLTICLCLAILLSSIVLALALVKSPPVIRVEVVTQSTKSEPVVQDVLMPKELLDYIDQESEDHARTGRRQRAKALFAEFKDWDIVFRQLQREDEMIDG